MNNSTCIALLARGEDYGIKGVEDFIYHYNSHSAGIEHALVIIAKAWDKESEDYKKLQDLATSNNAKIIDLPDDGFDFGAYFRATPLINADYIFFVNSNAIVLKDNWLKLLYDGINRDDVGIVGPTGSWEMPGGDLNAQIKSILKAKTDIFKKIKNLYKFYNSPDYMRCKDNQKVEFPNYHIRTCAFMIKRDLFLEYIQTAKFPKTKEDTYIIEHGSKSITNFVLNKGLKALVVGANGETYEPQDWPNSKTYRCEDTSNLIVADKHTKIYNECDEEYRKFLDKVAWNK